MGLSNVRQRLRTIYGAEAALRTDEDGRRFVAVLDLPLE
jgi:LytS/YehU family sensor histidine kinase